MLFNNGMFIKVDRTRCLNDLHKDIECVHCISHCPGHALRLTNKGIHLFKEDCLGCGLCFSDCPTQVFTAHPWDETSIVSEIENKGVKTIQFFCENHENPHISKKEEGMGAIQIPTCLGSLSKGVLYEIGLNTCVEMRLDNCFGCPMHESLERLEYKINTAIEWLEASGHVPEFTLIRSVGEIKIKKKLKASSSGMKTTSKRDLFLSLFRQGQTAVDKVKNNDFSINKGNETVMERSLLPTWRNRFGKAFTENYHKGGTPASWPSIVKNNSCVNCGVCTTNCPTGALEVNIVDQTAIHTFNSGICIDCRLCMLFCPTKSIVRDRVPKEAPFVEEVLIKLPVIICERCDMKAVNQGNSLCYWCKNEANDSEMIDDVWKFIM